MLIRTQDGYRWYDRSWDWTREQRQANERTAKLAQAVVRFGGYGAPKKVDLLAKRARRRRRREERTGEHGL